MIVFSSKRNAQSLIALMAIQRAMAEGKEVFVATADVRETIKRMADNFPGALFEINSYGFKIHLRKLNDQA